LSKFTVLLQSFGIIPWGEFYFSSLIGIHFSNDFDLYISLGFVFWDTNPRESSGLLVSGFKENQQILYK